MEQPTYEDVTAFLAQHSGGTASHLEQHPHRRGVVIGMGAYRAGGEELVIRFSRESSWYLFCHPGGSATLVEAPEC